MTTNKAARSGWTAAKPGKCRVCGKLYPAQRRINACLIAHGVRLAPQATGQHAKMNRKRKRAGEREARRVDSRAVGHPTDRATSGDGGQSMSAPMQPANAKTAKTAKTPHSRTWVRPGWSAEPNPQHPARRAEVERMRRRIAELEAQGKLRLRKDMAQAGEGDGPPGSA